MARQLRLGGLDPNTASGAQLKLQQQHAAVPSFVFFPLEFDSRLQNEIVPVLYARLYTSMMQQYCCRCYVLLLDENVVILADDAALTYLSLFHDPYVFSLVCGTSAISVK